MQLLKDKIVFIIGVIAVVILILYTAIGCTAMQKQMLKDGFVSLGDCAILSSLGCASQSMGGCPPPLTSWNGDDWGGYVGGTGPKKQSEILACVRDSEYETEAEAVTAVAACQRLICLNLED